MVVIVFVVGVVYDVVDKFWQIIDMIDKEEERQAVLVHVVYVYIRKIFTKIGKQQSFY